MVIDDNTVFALEEITTLNGGGVPAQKMQRVGIGIITGDGSANDLGGDVTYGLDVDVTRSALPTGASTEVTLAAVLAALSTDPATDSTLAAGITALLSALASVPVTGTFYQATQPVSGTVTANAGTNLNTSTLALETGGNLAAILAKLSSDPATQTTLAAVLAKLSSDPATQTTLAAILTKLNASLAVTGTFWQATQPVSGPLTDTQLRATAVPVSGTVTASGPLTDTQLRATAVPVSGTVTANVKPATSGGLSLFHLVSAASTNATLVKGSPGQVFGWYGYNSNAAARKIVLYDATTNPPVPGTTAVKMSIVIPAGSGANVEFTNGIEFATGIGLAMVTGLADSDTTGVAANDLVFNLMYK